MLLPGEANIVLDEDLRIAAIQRVGQRVDFDLLSGGHARLATSSRSVISRARFASGRLHSIGSVQCSPSALAATANPPLKAKLYWTPAGHQGSFGS